MAKRVNKTYFTDLGLREYRVIARLYLTNDDELLSPAEFVAHDKEVITVGKHHMMRGLVEGVRTYGEVVEILEVKEV